MTSVFKCPSCHSTTRTGLRESDEEHWDFVCENCYSPWTEEEVGKPIPVSTRKTQGGDSNPT